MYQKYDSQDGGGDIDNGVDAIVSIHGFPGCNILQYTAIYCKILIMVLTQ